MAAQTSNALFGAPASEPVHVFGTDLAGRHELPSAVFAVRLHGAKPGQASGMCGNSFAIAFRDGDCELLPLKQIATYVRDFLKYAAARPAQSFQITRFACGESAYEEAKLAVLFATAPIFRIEHVTVAGADGGGGELWSSAQCGRQRRPRP